MMLSNVKLCYSKQFCGLYVHINFCSAKLLMVDDIFIPYCIFIVDVTTTDTTVNENSYGERCDVHVESNGL